jgi:hypothetical protein
LTGPNSESCSDFVERDAGSAAWQRRLLAPHVHARCTRDLSARQKSKPRNRAVEIFAAAAAQSACENVSVANDHPHGRRKRPFLAANWRPSNENLQCNINCLIPGGGSEIRTCDTVSRIFVGHDALTCANPPEEAAAGVEGPRQIALIDFAPVASPVLPRTMRLPRGSSFTLANSLISWCRKRDSNPRPHHYE